MTPARNGRRLGMLALVLALAGSLVFLVHPWFDVTNDGSLYIVTARSILAGEGYTYNGTPFQVRPPGFSLLVASVLACFGTDFLALNTLINLFGAAGVVLLYLFASRRVGWRLALLLAVVIWLTPAYRRLCNQVMSDAPGVALIFLCLVIDGWVARAPSMRRNALLGLAVGLAAYVRTTSILLVPALIIARLARGSGESHGSRVAVRGAAVLALAAGLALAPWWVRTQVNPAPSPATQTRHYSYGTHTWHTDTGDPSSPRLPVGDVLARVPEHAEQATHILGARLDMPRGGPWEVALGLLLLSCTLAVLVRKREAPEIYAVVHLAAAFVSRDYLPRHLLPVFVIAVMNLALVVRAIGNRLRGGLGAPLASAALVGLLLTDWNPRPAWSVIERTHGLYGELARATEEQLAADARLGSPYGFVYAVYLERSVANVGFVVERAGDVRALEEEIDARGLDTVVLSTRVARDAAFVPYFAGRYGVEPRDGVLVVRVRP